MAFFIGVFIDSNAGWILSQELLGKLGAYGIGLEFDVYPRD